MVHRDRRVDGAEEVGGAGATKPLAQGLHAAGGPDVPPETFDANSELVDAGYGAQNPSPTTSSRTLANEIPDVELDHEFGIAPLEALIENLDFGTAAFKKWHHQQALLLVCPYGHIDNEAVKWWDEILEPGGKFDDFPLLSGKTLFRLDLMIAASISDAIDDIAKGDPELVTRVATKENEACVSGRLVSGRQLGWLILEWLQEKEAGQVQMLSKEGGQMAPLTDSKLPAAGGAGTFCSGNATADDPEDRKMAKEIGHPNPSAQRRRRRHYRYRKQLRQVPGEL